MKTMKIGENAKSAQQLYDAIDEELPKYYEVSAYVLSDSACLLPSSAHVLKVMRLVNEMNSKINEK